MMARRVMWRGGSASPALDSDAAVYLAAVEAADGQTLEPAVKTAINEFVVGCKTDGIWDAIKASCILAGARTLNGALVPLKGAAPTNYNFVSGDYNRWTGLLGNGSNKYLNSNRLNNADPQSNNHNAVYVTAAGTTGIRVFMGSNTETTTGSNIINYNTGFSGEDLRFVSRRSGNADIFSNQIYTTGLKGFTRSSGDGMTARSGGGGWYFPRTSAAAGAGNIFIFDRGPTPPHFPIDARIPFYSIGEALDLEKLDTRVTALVAAIGEAI